jgi:hypothetical protein
LLHQPLTEETIVTTVTRLEPLTDDRARELDAWLRQASRDENTALALDGDGRVLGVVGVDDPRTEHLLGDLDVHA